MRQNMTKAVSAAVVGMTVASAITAATVYKNHGNKTKKIKKTLNKAVKGAEDMLDSISQAIF